MALPPERITVKRRRDEDPVEALYIQPKKARPSAVWTLEGRAFSRTLGVLNSESNTELSHRSKFSTTPPPNANTSTSANLQQTNAPIGEQPNPTQLFQNLNHPFPRNEGGTDVARPKRPSRLHNESGISHATDPGLRTYQLSHASLSTSKRHGPAAGSIRKQRKPRRDDFLAVFVEKGRRWLGGEDRAQGQPGSIDSKMLDANTTVETGVPARKRPNASAAERAWRAETWGIAKTTQPVGEENERDHCASQTRSNWDDASLGLAQDLQKFAIEESRVQEERAQPDPAPAMLTFQPKPPKPRQAKTSATESTCTASPVPDITVEDDQDYVMDTYIRSELQSDGQQDSSHLGVDPLQGMDSSKVGILVIEEAEEERWETFADEQEREAELNSDEEDENAEDFYGNDYPEDEVNSDDEYGRNAYKYRTYASDDEEYGDGEPEYSDGEDQSH